MSKRGSCRHDNEVVVGHGTDVSHRGGHLAHGDCGCCGQRQTRWASMYRGVHTSMQERQVRRSQMKGRSRRVNYYQLIRLTRSPNGAKITRYFLTSMTGYLPAMPTRGRAHPNGSPLSTSNIRSIVAETT